MADVVHICSDGNPIIFCEGCKCGHKFYIESGAPYHDDAGRRVIWAWNNNIQHPTFTPSMLVNPNYPARRCHSVITGGWIQFCGDCFHDLKNQRIQLQPF
jgi:Family of unknown function (DUF6527)